MNKLTPLLIFFAVAFSAIPSAVQALQVDIVLPAENPALIQLAEKIGQHPDIKVSSFIGKPPPSSERGEALVFVSDKLMALAELEYPAIFGLYIDEQKFLENPQPNFTAVFSKQPVHRQLQLISAIAQGKAVTVGFAYQRDALREALQKKQYGFPHLEIRYRKTTSENREREINKLIQENQFLLSSGEEELYNASSIRSILLASYRHKTRVIGPSEAFVKAGALATTASQQQHYVSAIQAMLMFYAEQRRLPKAGYPEQFTVIINHNVAHSLELYLDEEQTLLKTMSGD